MSFRHPKREVFFVLLIFAQSTFFSEVLNAQSGTTSVSGTVFDQNRQALSGATVTLSNSEKGFSRTATTNETGTFIFPAVQPAIYRLEVEISGFKKFVNPEVRAPVDTPTEISAVLEVGELTETVNVKDSTAEALLNTQDATLGNPFSSNQIAQLPTEAREVLNLLTLQPGVTPFGYVVGGRSDQSNLTLDGVDVNDPVNNSISSPNLRLNAEAIEEFRVTISNAGALQGRSSGAQISLVTKSGTNNLRGALFLTGRRTVWTANDFFNNKAGVERPKLDRNVFGGAIGGPLWKNRFYFFYSYEGENTIRGQSVVRVVPLENLGQGIIRFRNTNNQIVSLNCSQIMTVFPNTGGCNPSALSVFASAASRYRANSFEIGDSLNTAGFRFNADNKIRKNSHVLRLDFNLDSHQQAFLRANYINDLETDAPQFPDTPAPTFWNHPSGFVIGHNWTISKNIFNNFRYGLTRNAFSRIGDSTDNAITFANIYSPRLFQRTLSPIDTVNNFTDDVFWFWRNHTFQFGTNLRPVRSRLKSFARSYDSAAINPLTYTGGGNSITNPLDGYLRNAFGYQIANIDTTHVQNAVAALLGRLSTYTANYTYLRDGTLQSAGTARQRDFKTEEYDFYLQDIWRIRPNLTLSIGLRYGLSRPIYEANGYEVKPTINLSEYFARRAAGAAQGTPYNELIGLDYSGAANAGTPLYQWDKNNFQPRLAFAWSPNFSESHLGWIFGKNNQSVLRGGFSLINDYLPIIMVGRFDNANALGFNSNSQIRNRYNLTSNVAPLFTGFEQNIRTLPDLTLPVEKLTFPRQAPLQNNPTLIETSLDEKLSAPTHYNWSLTFERILPGSLIVSVSYLGRKARNLRQPRDVAAIANFVDTRSGTDWNTAATQLEILRQRGTPVSQIQPIPYFANLFPSNLSDLLGCSDAYHQTQAVYSLVSGSCGTSLDWTDVQLRLSRLSSVFPGQHIFFQPQYGSYRAWSSIGKSDYQGLIFTLRQRLGTRLTMDFNYTVSKSSDDGSGPQTSSLNSTAAIINPFRPEDNYAASDFDTRHIINANAIFKLPIGRGETIFGNAGKLSNLFLGGWQLTGIFRANSGLPISAPTDAGNATSWSLPSYTTRTAGLQSCPTRDSLFGCNSLAAYRSFRNAYPGETGERNVFRLPGYWVIDLGLGKTFDLPWENHKFQFRWEVFNLANTQKLGSLDLNDYRVELDPQNASQTPSNWATFTAIQGNPRSMQFFLRYSF